MMWVKVGWGGCCGVSGGRWSFCVRAHGMHLKRVEWSTTVGSVRVNLDPPAGPHPLPTRGEGNAKRRVGAEDRKGTCRWHMRGTVAPVARHKPPNGAVRLPGGASRRGEAWSDLGPINRSSGAIEAPNARSAKTGRGWGYRLAPDVWENGGATAWAGAEIRLPAPNTHDPICRVTNRAGFTLGSLPAADGARDRAGGRLPAVRNAASYHKRSLRGQAPQDTLTSKSAERLLTQFPASLHQAAHVRIGRLMLPLISRGSFSRPCLAQNSC